MQPFKESIQFYYSNAGALLLFAVTVLLPFSLIQYYIANYVYYVTAYTGTPIFGNITDNFLMIVFLLVAQLPIIQYVQTDLEGEEKSLKAAYRTFWEYGFSVYLFAIVYGMLIMTGLFLLVIPGILILVFFYLTPFITVMKKQTTRHTFKMAYHVSKKHFLPIIGLIALSALVEVFFSAVAFVLVSFVTTKLWTVFITQTVIHIVVQPFFIVLFTMFLHKWRTESRATAAILNDNEDAMDHQVNIY